MGFANVYDLASREAAQSTGCVSFKQYLDLNHSPAVVAFRFRLVCLCRMESQSLGYSSPRSLERECLVRAQASALSQNLSLKLDAPETRGRSS